MKSEMQAKNVHIKRMEPKMNFDDGLRKTIAWYENLQLIFR